MFDSTEVTNLRPLIAIVDVISVLPHIEREERHHPVVDQRRVGIVKRGDLELVAVEHEPGPAVGEVVHRLVAELLKQRLDAAEPIIDQLRKLSARLLLFGAQALPEEAVVPQLGAVVEQLGLAVLPGVADDIDKRSPGQIRLGAHELVGLVDVGAVMLAPVEFEGLGRNVRRERILGVRQFGEFKRHFAHSYVGGRCNNEERASVAPLFIAGPCDSMFRGRKKFPRSSQRREGGNLMGKFFENLNGVLIAGLVLAILIALLPDSGYANSVGANNLWLGIFQWLHVFFGITWIGLLYYFNFVQIPTMPTVPAELKPGVSKYIAPKALFYFRWGAAFTVLTGLIVAYLYGEEKALLLNDPSNRLIGIGMWLALIMAFNVWFVIWPNQKRALGIVEADDATKAKSARTAMIFSRINTLLSIPMLLAMTNQH